MTNETQTRTPAARIGNRRWTICALLFFATTINYIDRSVINALGPTLIADLHWDKVHYGYVSAAFQVAYAIGLLVTGGIIDRVGVRKGFAWAVGLWSLAAMGTGLSHFVAEWLPATVALPISFSGMVLVPATVATFLLARFALGLTEAANFPAAVKTVAEWFPRSERALATGVFNAGSNVGAVLAPVAAVQITAWTRDLENDVYGWEWAFLITGAVGFVWLIWWLAQYRHPQEDPKLSEAELAHIMSDPPEPATKIPWARILPYRQTWAFAMGKMLTDPVWWFWLFWLGLFLKDRYGVELAGLAAPLVVIYIMADIGSVAGGWLSGHFLKMGWTVNAARKVAMLICALSVVPVILAPRAPSMWIAVGLISVAAAAHQAWSANLFTLISDTFPRRAVASVSGFGGMFGAAAGVFLTLNVGPYLKTHQDSYLPFFLFAGFGYLLALLVIHILTPRLERTDIDAEPAV